MTTITRSSLVLYTTDEMYDLVNDINAYPAFLPWCRSSKVLSASDDLISASLEIAKGGFHHTFSTRNKLNKGKTIDIELIHGPFQHLEGHWQFVMIGDNQGCRIQLDMDFEFSSRIVSKALSPIFSQISASMVEAFCKRAQEIYGKR